MPKLAYHLCWNNHLQNIQSLFESLYSEQSLVDVTISCCDGLLYAHKLILSACSPYFEQIFKANPCKHPVLILKGIKQNFMQVLLEYMYAGAVDVAEEDLDMLLNIATELQIKGLMQSSGASSENAGPSFVNNKGNQHNSDSKSLDSESSTPFKADNLKWQAELVAQPSISKPQDNHHLEPKGYHTVLESSGVQSFSNLIRGQNESGLELFPCNPVKEQINDNLAGRIKEELQEEDITTDYNEDDETIGNSNGSLEMSAETDHIENDKENFCTVCKREFLNRVAFQRHMLTHSGVKPHRCTFCAQSFLRLSHLQRHIRVHTGERPYSCTKCPKQFSRSDKLRQHYIFQHSDTKCGKEPRPRGRPRKPTEHYQMPPAPRSDINSYPPLSIIPITGNSNT